MSRLRITHETRYDYDAEVAFGDWRLMLRPTDSHALRVVSAELAFSPQGITRWVYDAFGNSICHLQPQGTARQLQIISTLVVDRFPHPLEDSMLQDPGTSLPILYNTSDLVALGPLIRPDSDDADGTLREWIRAQPPEPGMPALAMLKQLNQRIHGQLTYTVRHEEGVQDPGETLRRGTGACRDYAWLMIEVARRLGFAARYASGYVASAAPVTGDGGSTHAWCEIFLPDLGWIEFDPTNALAESHDLIRIAATRTPAEASPVQGSIIGNAGSSMFVSVRVEPWNADMAQPQPQLAGLAPSQ